MKKNLIAIIAVCTLATAAFADETPPPPPDQPSESGGSGIRAQGALLDASEKSGRPMLLSIHATLPYAHFYFGSFPIGGGASFYIPLVHNGFISKVNDEFGIDFGIDAIAYLGYVNPLALYIPVGVQWKFHILEKLEVYARVGFLARLWFGYASFFNPDAFGAVGLHYMFSKGFGFKVEVGYPGIRAGIVLAF